MLAYREEKTFFHNIDPITKFGWLSLVSLWLISLQDLVTICWWCGTLSLGVMFAAKINPLSHLRLIGVVLVGGVNLVVFQGFFREGEGIEMGWFHLSYSGMVLGAALTIRTLGIVFCSIAFSKTTDPKMVVLALVKLGMPYKYAHLAYLGLRFMPLLETDLRTIGDAIALRGIRGRWQKTKMAIITLITSELRRAEEIAIALETRAFSLYPTRTSLDEVVISRKGLLLLVFTLAVIGVNLGISWLSV